MFPVGRLPAALRADLVAGLTLAAYAIPVSLAYATLAGIPPVHGVYCYFIGGLCYALLGSSRQLAIGPTSAIAMLVGATIPTLTGGDPSRFAAVAALTAVSVALISALAWLLRLSGLVHFISGTILIGFKAGAALTIALTQLPKLFGVPGGGDHFFAAVGMLLGQLGQTNFLVLAIGGVAFALLTASDRFLPGRPAALFVVVPATFLVWAAGLDRYGVATVGRLPAGLPSFAWPPLGYRDIDGVFPLAAACFLLSYVESISAARTLAERHADEVDPRRELLALGAANLAVGFCQGFPVAGGLSQSAVNDKAGARSRWSLVFASATIGICLVFFTGLVRTLPTVVLAAIVLNAVESLIDVRGLRHLWKVSRFEFSVAMIALAGVLLLGILQGVLLAVTASLLLLISMVARPHVAFLGRIPGTRRYSDAERHPDNQIVSGLLLFRIESALVYFNVDHVRNVLRLRIGGMPGLREVVCDLSNSPYIDVAGAGLLAELYRMLSARGIRLRIVEAHAQVRDVLRAVGLEEQFGHIGRRLSLDQAVTEYERAAAGAAGSDASAQSIP